MNNTNPYKLATILVAIVLIVGISFYYYKSRTNPSSSKQTAVNEEPKVEENTVLETLNSALSADEKILLNATGATLSEAENQARFELAEKMAVEGKEIKLNECVASPVVLKVKNGTVITVYNNGPKDAPFGFDKEKVNVPRGGSISYKVNFKLGSGLYGYGCDNKDVHRGIGLLFVTP